MIKSGKRRVYKLSVNYDKLHWKERIIVREQYVKEQEDKCFYCKESLNDDAPKHITNKNINWDLFPDNFLRYPIHLQHNHHTGMTEGAVHSYCNAVMWQYDGR